jgi:putative NADH-flavin reductase
MSRVLVLGTTGSLGRHVVRQAVDAGHAVTAFVRTRSRLASDIAARTTVHEGDLAALDPAELAGQIAGHDALVNCAGHVADGARFVALVDRIVAAVESLPAAAHPISWFLAGAALLDIGSSSRRGVDLAQVAATYWPHRANVERLERSNLDWRLMCPGPMVDAAPLGVDRLRISIDRLPVEVPEHAPSLADGALLPLFASWITQVIVPYADAAALMLAHLDRSEAMARRRVGVALPLGMVGHEPSHARA